MELAKPKLANVCPSWAFVTPHTMQAAVEEASLVHLAACPTERALAMVALLGITLSNILLTFLRRHSTQSPLDHEIAWLSGAAALLVLAAVLRDGQARYTFPAAPLANTCPAAQGVFQRRGNEAACLRLDARVGEEPLVHQHWTDAVKRLLSSGDEAASVATVHDGVKCTQRAEATDAATYPATGLR